MDPVTHFMTGGCLARAGFNRKTRYATLVMVLAAEAPDLDTLWGLRGPIASFQHHRGWTHTLIGLPVDAVVVLAAVWLFDRLRSTPIRTPALPTRWPLLFLFALVALLSHLLLDWTNNYGIRPFFPFNPRWYAGSFVFIVEPVMLLLLAIGLVAPSLFGLISSEIGARRDPFPGRGWAIFALVGVLALYAVRGYERLEAGDLAHSADYNGASVLRATVSPYPIDPFRWHGVVETPNFYQTSTINSLAGFVATSAQNDIFYKGAETPATLAAKRSHLGRVYLDWSSYPVVTQTTITVPSVPAATTEVTFRDLRFLYNTLGMQGRDNPPLSGEVLLTPANTVLQMSMDGRPGR